MARANALSSEARQTPLVEKREGAEAADLILRVCFVSPLGHGLYHPESRLPFGGAEVQSFLTAGALAKDARFEVTVLTTVERGPSVEHVGAVRLVSRQGRGRLGTARGVGPLAYCRDYWSAFREMWAQFQWINADVYVHAGAGVEVGAYALICRLMHRRFIFVVASDADLSERYGMAHGPLRRLYPLGIRLADLVICRTEEQRLLLQRRFGREGIVIRSGHPIPPMVEKPRHTVLWVGRIHPVKQPRVFLDLAARCPEFQFAMVGMRDQFQMALWEDVEARARDLPNLLFQANLSLARVDEVFRSAKVFVNTSLYEGFPNTFVQAAASAIPIVSLSVDPDRVIARQQIGICAEGSFESLVTAVHRLCQDERLREDNGRRARVYALEHHNLEHSVMSWKELLFSVTRPEHTEQKRVAA